MKQKTQTVGKTTMKEEIKTIAEQINWKELAFCKFRFVYDNDNLNIGIIKGNKTLVISLDEGKDLYNIRKLKHRAFTITQDETVKGIFCDQLCDIIEEFFKFSYINKVRFG